MDNVPVSLYIHFPWCIKKCPYCDFNSHESNRGFDSKRYIQALIRDFTDSLSDLNNRTIQTIFLGGGTPSLFSGSELAQLFTHIKDHAEVATNAEITMEANPGSLECGAFQGYLNAGINRLSLGVQSFDNRSLKALGRIHDGETAATAIQNAQTEGFENINLDLMFALPGQSVDEANQDCDQAISFATPHLSFYQLTIEPNTLFHKFPPKQLPDADAQHDIQQSITEKLCSAGYNRYEVSAYARPGKRCKHNVNYWAFGDYLGIGAGAHSKISGSNIRRFWKEKQPKSYMEKVEAGVNHSNLSLTDENDVLFEFMLNALRLSEGFAYADFEQRTGLERERAQIALAPFKSNGWILMDDAGARCSETGYQFIDEILQKLLPDED